MIEDIYSSKYQTDINMFKSVFKPSNATVENLEKKQFGNSILNYFSKKYKTQKQIEKINLNRLLLI